MLSPSLSLAASALLAPPCIIILAATPPAALPGCCLGTVIVLAKATWDVAAASGTELCFAAVVSPFPFPLSAWALIPAAEESVAKSLSARNAHMFLSSELLWHLVRGGFSMPCVAGTRPSLHPEHRTLSGQVLTAPLDV